MAVEWEVERRRRGAEMTRVEERAFASFSDLVGATLTRVQPRVLAGGRVDPRGAFAAQGWWPSEMGGWVDDHLACVAWAALDAADVEHVIPESVGLINEYLASAKNRLVGVPDRVYAALKEIVVEGVDQGDSNEDLAERIEKLFANEGVEMWDSRVATIVRTEALAAQNAGTYASFLSIAALDDTPWEKAWLSTVDNRVRETHKRADQQRVPLKGRFQVGRSRLLFPGDPSGPPEEVINCRCSLLLLEPGEEIDLTNRQFEEG